MNRFCISSAFPLALALAGAVHAQERRLLEPVFADARTLASDWRFSTEFPGEAWWEPAFDDQAWQTGYGGFGAGAIEGGNIATDWSTPEIWMRKTFTLPEGRYSELILSLHHDDDAEVYINGRQVFAEAGWTTAYNEFYVPADVFAALKPGPNLIAIHCSNAGSGPQYVDAGLSGARNVNVSLLSPDARVEGKEWKWSPDDPGVEWYAPGFDDAAWNSGKGGFGTGDLYASYIGTEWAAQDIWMRRTFTAEKEFPEYMLSFHHDDDIEIYINGNPVLSRSGWSTEYQEELLLAAQAHIKAGENVLAVHCANTGTGPQFVDVGILGVASGGIPTRLVPNRAATKPGRPPLFASRGAVNLAPFEGAAGRLEIFALDGRRAAILKVEAGRRVATLPAELPSGAWRYRFTAGATRSEGRLVQLP